MLTSSQSQSQQLQLHYPTPVRLQQILADSQANLSQLLVNSDQTGRPIYWTGAGVFTAFPHPDKANVLNQLNTLVQQAEREVLVGLKNTLDALAIGQRVFTPLDYDHVRINKADNPLVKQNLTLVLPPRPSTVLVLGAVHKPQYLSWQTRKGADDYLKQAQPADIADNSVATVIQPDGNVEQHPIAYWNHNHRDIAPGAIVYLGFSSLPSGYKDLNDAIINLLRNRAL
ncbi:capsule biosynthesis GfcC family protein [Photobacterium sp. SDRW27]|uniref:capsule biosynthesis GfcC family protein n=1 Tax=Photobacterium obscurum TaxID=2829490 RepID=UPI002243527D|nr:capsule biosynthesis GfcC family protein [Photobacterium obscurum]MCW8328220.1 capsule biosynthesis GfcC family protein [Photobacterium obscurum]